MARLGLTSGPGRRRIQLEWVEGGGVCVLVGRCGWGRGSKRRRGNNHDSHLGPILTGRVWGYSKALGYVYSRAPASFGTGAMPSQEGSSPDTDAGIAESGELVDWHPETLLST